MLPGHIYPLDVLMWFHADSSSRRDIIPEDIPTTIPGVPLSLLMRIDETIAPAVPIKIPAIALSAACFSSIPDR